MLTREDFNHYEDKEKYLDILNKKVSKNEVAKIIKKAENEKEL